VFRRSADKLIALLAEQTPPLKAMRNPDPDVRPRRGTFEVRLADGTEVVSLKSMPRPFRPLRALDIEELAVDTAKAAKSGGSSVKAGARSPQKIKAGVEKATNSSHKLKKAAPKSRARRSTRK